MALQSCAVFKGHARSVIQRKLVARISAAVSRPTVHIIRGVRSRARGRSDGSGILFILCFYVNFHNPVTHMFHGNLADTIRMFADVLEEVLEVRHRGLLDTVS